MENVRDSDKGTVLGTVVPGKLTHVHIPPPPTNLPTHTLF